MLRPIVALSACLALLSGCGGEDGNGDGSRTHRSTIDGQNVRLDLPTSGDTKGLAIWFHGQGADENFRMNEDWLNAIREQGWAVASGELGGSSWANPASSQQAADLIDWAEQESDSSARLFVSGSMGSAVSINAMRAHDLRPQCWYGVMPVIDLDAVAGVPRSADEMSEAWGGTVPVRGNPVSGLDELPSTTRYRILASESDTWVPFAANSQVLIDSLESVDADVAHKVTEGPHGDPSNFDSNDLATFASSCR